MEYYESTYTYTPHLAHHGIQGMRWGIRKYQNSDGSLTPEGRIRYGRSSGKMRSQRVSRASEPSKSKSSKAKKALIAGAAVVGTGLLAYGAYKTGVLDNVLSKNNSSIPEEFSGVRDLFSDNLNNLSNSSDAGRKAQDTVNRAAETLRRQSNNIRSATSQASNGSYASRVTSIPGLQDMFKQNLSDLSGSSAVGRRSQATADNALNEMRRMADEYRKIRGR